MNAQAAPPNTNHIITPHSAISFFNDLYTHHLGEHLEIEYLHHDGEHVEPHTASGVMHNCTIYRNIVLLEGDNQKHHHPFFGVDSAILSIRTREGKWVYQKELRIQGPLSENEWRKEMNQELEKTFGRLSSSYMLSLN
jgi:hypothetical protein